MQVLVSVTKCREGIVEIGYLCINHRLPMLLRKSTLVIQNTGEEINFGFSLLMLVKAGLLVKAGFP